MTDTLQKRSILTRDAILEAAAQLIHEQGASALTLDATCARAGMSKGGLLYHFRTKEDLMVALMDHRQKQMTEAVHKEYDRDPDPSIPGRHHRAMIRAVFGILLSENPFQLAVMGGVAVQMLASGGESSRRLREGFDCHRRTWGSTLEQDGLLPVQSLAIHSALDGLISHQIMHQENPPREVLQQMRSLLLDLASPGFAKIHNPLTIPETA